MFSSESSSYKTTTLQLSHTPSRRSRRVWHLQYSGWQDHGCPEDVSQYLAFCEEMGALRRHTVGLVERITLELNIYHVYYRHLFR